MQIYCSNVFNQTYLFFSRASFMNSFLLIVFAFVVMPTVVELSQPSSETDVNTHICYYLNKEEDVYIPIAAIFGYPKEKRLLIFDYLGMYYEVGGGNGDDDAIRLSPDRGVRISLEKASTGQWAVRWPGLTSVVAGDTEAIVYKDKSWFCFFNKTENNKQTGKCFSKNDTESMDFNETFLKHATSDDFHEKFQSLTKCRVKSSLKRNGEFTMQFVEKANLEGAIKNDSLECPVVWRTNEAFNATLFEYEGVVFIINLLYAYAFRRSDVVGGGSTIVSRIPLKHLFHCDPKMVIRKETFAFGLSLRTFIFISVGGFFVLLILCEIAYIAGAFESRETAFYDEQRSVAKSKRKRGKKQKKKTLAPKKTKKYIGSLIGSVEQVPSLNPDQEMQEMPADDDDGVEETAETTPVDDTTGSSTGFSPSSNDMFYGSGAGSFPLPQQTAAGNYGMHPQGSAPPVHNHPPPPPPPPSGYGAQAGLYPNQPSSGGYYPQPTTGYPYQQEYYQQQQQQPPPKYQ